MKRTLFLISVVSVFAALLSAQDDAAYTTAMKTVNPAVRAVNPAIAAKDNAAVAAAAKTLVDAFTTINAYWTAKKTEDAIALSATAKSAASALAAATDADAQTAALKQLQGTCQPCHAAHRGGMPPAFQIK